MGRGSVFLTLQRNLGLKGPPGGFLKAAAGAGEACGWRAAWRHQAVGRRPLLTGKMGIHSPSVREHVWNDVWWCAKSYLFSLGDVKTNKQPLVFTAICRKRDQILWQSGELDPDRAHVSTSLTADIKGVKLSTHFLPAQWFVQHCVYQSFQLLKESATEEARLQAETSAFVDLLLENEEKCSEKMKSDPPYSSSGS